MGLIRSTCLHMNARRDGGTKEMPQASAGTAPALPDKPRAARALSSADLLAGEREVAIVHGHETYRLSLTATGKLILTK